MTHKINLPILQPIIDETIKTQRITSLNITHSWIELKVTISDLFEIINPSDIWYPPILVHGSVPAVLWNFYLEPNIGHIFLKTTSISHKTSERPPHCNPKFSHPPNLTLVYATLVRCLFYFTLSINSSITEILSKIHIHSKTLTWIYSHPYTNII